MSETKIGLSASRNLICCHLCLWVLVVTLIGGLRIQSVKGLQKMELAPPTERKDGASERITTEGYPPEASVFLSGDTAQVRKDNAGDMRRANLANVRAMENLKKNFQKNPETLADEWPSEVQRTGRPDDRQPRGSSRRLSIA